MTDSPIDLPASAGICAYDLDEATVTLALDSEAEVKALVARLPGKNRVARSTEGGEPVAWRWRKRGGLGIWSYGAEAIQSDDAESLIAHFEIEPLYLSPQPPGDFVSVPREPTEAMLQAACDATFWPVPLTPEEAHRKGFAAMLAASPKQGVEAKPRFYIEHGVIHDSNTGKHVRTDEPPSTNEDGIDEACSLLNALSTPSPRVSVTADEIELILRDTLEVQVGVDDGVRVHFIAGIGAAADYILARLSPAQEGEGR